MKMIKFGDRFEISSKFEEKDIIKVAGFLWDRNKKVWWTKFPSNAAKLVNVAEMDDELKKELESATSPSRAIAADVEIPAPSGLQYMPFQKAGIMFMHNRANTLLADEMGLGKTIQAIGFLNLHPEIEKILIICPASLKLNWCSELAKWLVHKRTMSVISAASAPSQFVADIVIINYDILKKHISNLLAYQWDLWIADEIHKIKSEKSQRTRYATQVAYHAKRKIGVTGTPIVNRPIELWPILQILDPENWQSFWSYVRRYCNAHYNGYGWDFSGASNLGELQNRLRSTIMVRRLKNDVLTDLPAKIRQIVEVPANGAGAAIKAEQDAMAKWHDILEAAELDRAYAETIGREAYEDAVLKLEQLYQAYFTEIAKLRHETALAKVEYVVEYCRDLLESTDKIIVMAHHHDVIKAIRQGLDEFSPVVFSGETKMEDRQAVVEMFQSDPSVRVFIGSITAAGTGITLTASSVVVFAELDWVPGNMTQAEDRAHRIGQKTMVNVYHVVLDGSLDAKLAKTLIAKQKVLDKTLDKESETQTIGTIGMMEEIMKPRHADERLDAHQIPIVHRMLKILAGLDLDRARVVNQAGFNRLDSKIGHALSEQPELSFRQAQLGKRICRKYRRQLPEDLYIAVYGDDEQAEDGPEAKLNIFARGR